MSMGKLSKTNDEIGIFLYKNNKKNNNSVIHIINGIYKGTYSTDPETIAKSILDDIKENYIHGREVNRYYL